MSLKRLTQAEVDDYLRLEEQNLERYRSGILPTDKEIVAKLDREYGKNGWTQADYDDLAG